MDGTVDLSSETFNGTNLPAAEGLGCVITDLSESNWTITLTNEVFTEIAQMVNQMRDNPLPRLLRKPSQFRVPNLREADSRAKNSAMACEPLLQTWDSCFTPTMRLALMFPIMSAYFANIQQSPVV